MTTPGRRALLAVGILGLALRVAVLLGIPVFPTVANTWDSNFYHEAALSLARDQGYSYQQQPTAFYPPGFPVALSGAYRILPPEPRSGQALNLLLSVLIWFLAARWARDVFGPAAGRWAFLLFALDPSQILMPAFLMSEVLCGLLILVLVVGVWKAGQGRWLWLAGAALAGAAGGMTRGHVFLLLPVIPFLLWFRGGLPARRALVVLSVLVAVSGVTVGAWATRNREKLGRAVPVATNAGINLLLGNNPNSWGGRADPPGGVPQTGNEIVDERIATDRALEFIRRHPLRFLGTLPLKAVRLWGFGPAVTYRGELRAKLGATVGLPAAAAAQAFHLVVLALALAGVRRTVRRQGRERVATIAVFGVLVVWTAGHLPFLGGARYLFPVYPLLLILAAARLRPGTETAS